MPGKFHHEAIYRGSEAMAKLAALRVTLCGAGAVGSHLADNLVRQGLAKLKVIDHDRVEEHNIGTQLYGQAEVGVWKVDALRARLFRAASVEIDATRKELTAQNARTLLAGCDLVIDAFDNAASRSIVQSQCRESGIACLHVGLAADYGEVIWDERYRIPRDVGADVCDYPMAESDRANHRSRIGGTSDLGGYRTSSESVGDVKRPDSPRGGIVAESDVDVELFR